MKKLNDYDSPYNQLAENPEHSRIPRNVEIHDLTLEADGEEMAGLRFTHKDRIAIAKGLDEASIHRISVLGNSPHPTRGEIRSAQAIVDLGLNTKIPGRIGLRVIVAYHGNQRGAGLLGEVQAVELFAVGPRIFHHLKRLTQGRRQVGGKVLHTFHIER